MAGFVAKPWLLLSWATTGILASLILYLGLEGQKLTTSLLASYWYFWNWHGCKALFAAFTLWLLGQLNQHLFYPNFQSLHQVNFVLVFHVQYSILLLCSTTFNTYPQHPDTENLSFIVAAQVRPQLIQLLQTPRGEGKEKLKEGLILNVTGLFFHTRKRSVKWSYWTSTQFLCSSVAPLQLSDLTFSPYAVDIPDIYDLVLSGPRALFCFQITAYINIILERNRTWNFVQSFCSLSLEHDKLFFSGNRLTFLILWDEFQMLWVHFSIFENSLYSKNNRK